jgi:WD40 repeat protein
LWDAAMGKPVGEPLRGHTSSVTSVSFSPDGTRITTSSDDMTVRVWNAPARQPSQQRVTSDASPFPDEQSMIEPISTMTSNTWNNHFISYSPNSTHALHNTSELTERASHDNCSWIPFVLDDTSGWVAGPKRRLLFWVPPASRRSFYNPATVLVIPGGIPELDLSRMAHGRHWHKCRKE